LAYLIGLMILIDLVSVIGLIALVALMIRGCRMSWTDQIR
jgi:hypothetical protein